jgi:hypothetical protein
MRESKVFFKFANSDVARHVCINAVTSHNIHETFSLIKRKSNIKTLIKQHFGKLHQQM